MRIVVLVMLAMPIEASPKESLGVAHKTEEVPSDFYISEQTRSVFSSWCYGRGGYGGNSSWKSALNLPHWDRIVYVGMGSFETRPNICKYCYPFCPVLTGEYQCFSRHAELDCPFLTIPPTKPRRWVDRIPGRAMHSLPQLEFIHSE